MKHLFLLFALLASGCMAVRAEGPQLVFRVFSGEPEVVRVAEIERLDFEPQALKVSLREGSARLYAFSDLQNFMVDYEGSYGTSGVTAVKQASPGALGISLDAAHTVLKISRVSEDTPVAVYSASGQLVARGTAGADIDISNLGAGLYLVKCGRSAAKFIK